MRNGRRGRSLGGAGGSARLIGLLLIAALVVAQGLQAAALRSCPHHAIGSAGSAEVGDVHGGVTPSSSALPSGSAPHAPHAPAHDAPADSHRSHDDAPCDCLGPCGAAASVHVSVSGSLSALVAAAAPGLGFAESREFRGGLLSLPFALPYPNAPPA